MHAGRFELIFWRADSSGWYFLDSSQFEDGSKEEETSEILRRHRLRRLWRISCATKWDVDFHHAAPQTNILTLTTGGYHHIMFDKYDSTSLVPIKLIFDYIYYRLDSQNQDHQNPADDEASSLCSQRPKLHEILLFDHRSIEGCTKRSASSRTANHLCSPRYNFTPVRHDATRHVNKFEPKIAPFYNTISSAASSAPNNSWEQVEQPKNLRLGRRVAWADLTTDAAEGVHSQKLPLADCPEVVKKVKMACVLLIWWVISRKEI